MDRPTHAESARTLVEYHEQATLSTLDRDSGTPYGSIAEYAPLSRGDALLFVSDLADHTKNVDADARASLLVAEELGAPEPLTRARASLIGRAEPCDPERREALAETYLETHPHAELYIDFEDFGFYRFRPERIRYIGGFGRMGWVEGEEYRDAEPDPLRPAAEGIIAHMNEDHADALVEMARALGEASWTDRARLLDVDRYGCDISAEAVPEGDGDEQSEEIRVPFDEPLDDPGEAREAFIALVERARAS